MRLMAIGIAGFAVLAGPLSAHGPARQHTDQSAMPVSARSAAATVDAFHAALARGETQSAAALLADDALIFEEGGVERSKAEYQAHHLPADAKFSRAVSSVVTRRSGGSNGSLAWIASEGRTTGTYKGKTLDLLTTETVLLRRTSAGWRIVHIHWSSAKRG